MWEDEASEEAARLARLGKLFVGMISLAHVVGCMFMFIAVSEDVSGGERGRGG
jgi:hypothetical protein